MANIKWDTKNFNEGIQRLLPKAKSQSIKAIGEVADEVLRLSQFEVPHDVGSLQNSGHTEPDGDDYLVGYNKVYAARLHEHPEYRFQKGRKGKYLEDPIKQNTKVFLDFFKRSMGGIF